MKKFVVLNPQYSRIPIKNPKCNLKVSYAVSSTVNYGSYYLSKILRRSQPSHAGFLSLTVRAMQEKVRGSIGTRQGLSPLSQGLSSLYVAQYGCRITTIIMRSFHHGSFGLGPKGDNQGFVIGIGVPGKPVAFDLWLLCLQNMLLLGIAACSFGLLAFQVVGRSGKGA